MTKASRPQCPSCQAPSWYPGLADTSSRLGLTHHRNIQGEPRPGTRDSLDKQSWKVVRSEYTTFVSKDPPQRCF
ncbi:hypothetical protein ElyMa_006254400 [Elysia marginata]|uniref:Uncharacterized protein n=1 Tax=Elysia marginata TaxID=1093978 RepID=A0AAV4H9L2_9GAST|nr:hypothetical protein ElyMa_006254400 [Elysia marginata]